MKKFIFLFVMITLMNAGTSFSYDVPEHDYRNVNMRINEEPYLQVIKYPVTDFFKLKSFTILLLSDAGIGDIDNSIIKKQMFFVVKNKLEEMGYLYTKDTNTPDFMVLIYFSKVYKTYYVPPELAIIPQRITGFSSVHIFNYNNRFSVWRATNIEIPDYWTTKIYTLPESHYYPAITVKLIDNINKVVFWEGIGVKHSNNSNNRSTYQVLLPQILGKFPHVNIYYKDFYQEWNFLGMVVLIMTMILIFILV